MSVVDKMFAAIDKDGSGTISQGEMDAVFKKFDNDGKSFRTVGNESQFASHILIGL